MDRKATTLRMDPVVRDGLSKLSTILGRSLNDLTNEALKEFITRRTLEVERGLESTLADLRAYRQRDPNFERAIGAVADAEASAKHDPAEGHVVNAAGATESIVIKLLKE